MYRFQLTQLRLNDGSCFTPGPLTVLVGPNNTGKSRLLKDIVYHVAGIGLPPLIVKGIAVTIPDSLDELLASYPHVKRRHLTVKDTKPRGVWLGPNLCTPGGHQCTHRWPQDFVTNLATAIKTKGTHQFLLRHFGSGLLAHLTTEHRLQLVNQLQTVHMQPGQKQRLLHALYDSGRGVEEKIREIVKHEFDKEVALDF